MNLHHSWTNFYLTIGISFVNQHGSRPCVKGWIGSSIKPRDEKSSAGIKECGKCSCSAVLALERHTQTFINARGGWSSNSGSLITGSSVQTLGCQSWNFQVKPNTGLG